jgi:hypothetical protein
MKIQRKIKLAVKFFRNLTFIQIARFFLCLFVVFVPFQMKSFFQIPDLYSSGQISQYANFFLYLSDMFLIFALIFLGISYLFDKGKYKPFSYGNKKVFFILLILIALIEISSFWASSSMQSFVTMIRFVEYLIFYLMVINSGLSMRLLGRVFLFVVVGQALIGISQYIFQSSIGLYFLGEPYLLVDFPGIAKVDLGSMQFLRSYGTFAHPNIFGGFLIFAILLAFSRIAEDKFLYSTFILIFFVALILTFSRSAWLACIFAAIYYVLVTRPKLKVNYLLMGILVFLIFLVAFDLDKVFLNRVVSIEDLAITTRMEYVKISKDMLIDKPYGVGIGNFTLEMQNFAERKLMPWDLQPVHNIFLLAMNEVGIWIFPVIVWLFAEIFSTILKKRREFVSGGDRRYGFLLLSFFFAILTIGNLDHYLFSLMQGQFLLFFYLLLVNDFVLRKTPM